MMRSPARDTLGFAEANTSNHAAFCRPGYGSLQIGDRSICTDLARYIPLRNRGTPIPRQPKSIGGHLRRRRAEFHQRQPQVAKALRVSTVTLSRWECDKVYPTASHHPAIVRFLGFDPFQSREKRPKPTNGTTA